jgi:repressor LexA
MPKLTPVEKRFLDLIRRALKGEGESPTFDELRRAMGWGAVNMVTKYVERLRKKGLILTGPSGSKRSIRLVEEHRRGAVSLPLWGLVHAGPLTEGHEAVGELIDAPEWMVPPHADCGFLQVRGDSMKDKGIFDGDYVLIRRQATAENRQTVVVGVGGAMTLKQIFFHPDCVELIPFNPDLKPMRIPPKEDLRIIGVCVGLIRRRL